MNINEKLAEAVAAYKAMTPRQKALHDHEQRRSFVRGMCPSRMDYDEWCKLVDETIPPLVDAPPK